MTTPNHFNPYIDQSNNHCDPETIKRKIVRLHCGSVLFGLFWIGIFYYKKSPSTYCMLSSVMYVKFVLPETRFLRNSASIGSRL